MIKLKEVKEPQLEEGLTPIMLTDETMLNRKNKILNKMKEADYDSIILYADLEHGSNFEYLVGFVPRFEEALLVLHHSGEAYLVLGNENLNKSSKARIKNIAVLMPHLSLPNQPMEREKTVKEILSETNIETHKKIGIVGWKNFTSKNECNTKLFDIPYYLMEAIKELCVDADFYNAASMFIGSEGARTINDANEFAHYEFGAALAGNCMLEAMNALEVGKTEMEIANHLNCYGQNHSVVTIMATGDRFEKGNMYPSNKKIKLKDPISMTVGFKGGLQSRVGYAIKNENELDEINQDYLGKVAIPYYNAIKTWIENIQLDSLGYELYNVIEEVLPKARYGWSLNPGHLCADEEWLSSPIYPNSLEKIKSGMLFQLDIIPSIKGYAGISCESGVFLADEVLRKEIASKYPDIWRRIEKRVDYMKNVLNIAVPIHVLPTSCLTAYCRPYLLSKKEALVYIEEKAS